MVFARSVSQKVRGASLESAGTAATKKSILQSGVGRTVQTRSLNESRQQIIGEFLPKVDQQISAGGKKEKMNVTHYYTHNSKGVGGGKNQQWMENQKFMPYSSNASSVEAIATRLMKQQTATSNG